MKKTYTRTYNDIVQITLDPPLHGEVIPAAYTEEENQRCTAMLRPFHIHYVGMGNLYSIRAMCDHCTTMVTYYAVIRG